MLSSGGCATNSVILSKTAHTYISDYGGSDKQLCDSDQDKFILISVIPAAVIRQYDCPDVPNTPHHTTTEGHSSRCSGTDNPRLLGTRHHGIGFLPV